MKYLHTMIRIKNLDESMRFFCEGLGLKETRRMENEKGRFTLIFLAPPNDEKTEIELTYNWDGDELGEGSRNFGHLAYRVDNIYETCQKLMDMGPYPLISDMFHKYYLPYKQDDQNFLNLHQVHLHPNYKLIQSLFFHR